MPKDPLHVRRLPERLSCDASRTIPRFFWPGSEERAQRIMDRVMGLDAGKVSELLRSTIDEFDDRHPDLNDVLTEHYEHAASHTHLAVEPSDEQRLLIGAYFTMEYAFESAALFNPSMVPARHQEGIAPGATRFLMSLRAVGEGHISSIVFRTGTIDGNGDLEIDPVKPQYRKVRVVENAEYHKELFRLKLIEMGAYDPAVDRILDRLAEQFTRAQLREAAQCVRCAGGDPAACDLAARNMTWLARSNYEIQMAEEEDVDQIVLFPISEAESRGMEDMRLVRFEDDDGSTRYYGTYTAYDGHHILPQILESDEVGVARIHTLNGRFAQNKGMALFPRKVDGWYAMIGRIDGENLYLLQSDNIHFWNEAERIQEPKYAWDFVQIGNCGSPIETEAGWLLLTHGVGPMRRYCIGASLLDLDDPGKVIGQLDEPLLMPTEDERSGYVPNVVYSCGGMVHNGLLVIPYGISDAATGFATVPMGDLLDRLRT